MNVRLRTLDDARREIARVYRLARNDKMPIKKANGLVAMLRVWIEGEAISRLEALEGAFAGGRPAQLPFDGDEDPL